MNREIRNASGERIDYTYVPGADEARVVVLGHGVTGNKDRAVMVNAAEALQAAGFATLRFSFAGNGSSEGEFVQCTISKEVGDLGSVLDALEGKTIAYVGHSMGGAVGVIRASEDARIKLLVSLAGMVDTAGFAQREFGMEVPDKGCMWEDESCPLSSTYMEDMAKIASVLPLAEKIKVPWLLLHGTGDDVVPIADSEAISAKASQPSRFVSIEEADHSFSQHVEAMSAELVAWVREHLR